MSPRQKMNIYRPTYVGQIRMLDGQIIVKYERHPNLWHRFWYWFLLGWKCEKLS